MKAPRISIILRSLPNLLLAAPCCYIHWKRFSGGWFSAIIRVLSASLLFPYPPMYHLSFMCTRYMERYLPECDLASVAHVRDCSLASARNARPIRVTARYIRAVCAIGESTYALLQPQSNARESVEMHQRLPSLSCRLCQPEASPYIHVYPYPCIHTIRAK